MRFEVYSVGEADMNATLEAVRWIVGPEGHVAADARHRRLIVSTTADRHSQISDLLRQLSGPPRNVLIEVHILASSRQQKADASLDVSGDIIVERDDLALGKIRLKPRVEQRTTAHASGTRQTLLVGSGREASLRVGENVPYIEWINDFALRIGSLQKRIAWQQVGAFLVVQPTILSDGSTLRVRVTPELRGLIDGRPERVRFTSMTTEVVTKDGVPIIIGGLGQHAEFYDRYLIGRSSSGAEESLRIQLVPRIQPIATRPN
jgi:hypothetical protein